MELLFGHDMQELLENKGVMNPHQLAELLRQSALALDRTHAAGIVHRDLKPENLFVTRRDDGTPHVKVLDFGIAKVVADGVKATNQTATIGTPMYMAPEQIQAKAEIGAATDIYALAQVAYTMLVGEPYFEEESSSSTNTFQLIMAVAAGVGESAKSRAARRRNVTLSDAVNDWFMRATDKEPARRFSTPGEAAEAFKRCIGGTGDFRMSIPDTNQAYSPPGGSADLSTGEFLASQRGGQIATANTMATDPSAGVQPPPGGAGQTQVAGPGALPTPGGGPTTSAAIAAPPAPAKRGGAGALLAVAGVAVLLGGGFTAWRFMDSEEEPVAETTEKSHDDDEDDKPKPAASAAAGLPTTCPADMVKVPRGTFTMGGGQGDAAPPHEVQIGPFCIDKTEVTVGAYKKCIEAGDCDAQKDIHWTGAGDADHERFDDACNLAQANRDGHPMNCVDWTHADKYCAFAKKRLPREPEWELAARGTESFVLTWGKGKGALSPKLLNACGKECKDRFGKGRTWNMMYTEADPYPGTAPADQFTGSASPYGALNMAGNVMEWTSDWFVRYEGSTSADVDPKAPEKPAEEPRKVARGGSFLSYSTDQVTTYHRIAYATDFRNVTTGMRCALSLAPEDADKKD